MTKIPPARTLQPSNISWGFAGAIVILFVVKLVLVAHHEISATGRGHDDLWQILSASNWYWRRPYDFMALIHLPIYPIAIALVSESGIPLRVASEFSFLIGAASFASAWGRLALPTWTRVLIFAVIAFHPYTIDVLDCAFAEVFYATLMLLAAAQFVRVLAFRDTRDLNWNALLLAIFFALAWHTRKEAGPLMGGFLVLTVAVIGLSWALRRIDRLAAWNFFKGLVLGPAIVTMALGATLITISGLKFGSWSTNELTSANYSRAFARLQQIDVPPIRFVPVTQAARELAYGVSPAFRELKSFLEDGQAAQWTRHEGEMFAGTRDLYAGYFYWILRDAVMSKGYHDTAAHAEAFYGRVADELEQAFKTGALKKRSVPITFIDPNFSTWLPYLPDSIANISSLLFAAHLSQCASDSILPASTVELFDRVANRRTPPPTPPEQRASIEGWLSTQGSPIKTFELVGHDLVTVDAKIETRPLPDVGLEPNVTPAIGFKIDFPFRPGLLPYGFRISRENGTQQLTPGLEHVPLSHPMLINDRVSDPLQLNITSLQEPKMKKEWRRVASDWLAANYNAIMKNLSWCVLLAFAATVIVFRTWPLSSKLTLAIAAMMTLVASRVLLFAILDASAWSGMQPRYLFPVATIASALPVIALGGIAHFAARLLLKRRWP